MIDVAKAREDIKTANKPSYDYYDASDRCINVHLPFALARIEELEAQIAALKTIAIQEKAMHIPCSDYHEMYPNHAKATTLARQQLEAEYPEAML
jgi:hypothetical protein